MLRSPLLRLLLTALLNLSIEPSNQRHIARHGVAPLLRVAQAARDPKKVRLVVARAGWAETELKELESRGAVVSRLDGAFRAAELGSLDEATTVLYAGAPTFVAQVRVALRRRGHVKAYSL